MAYVSNNYTDNPDAPIDQETWVGDPPYKGQCVSYVKFVTPGLPQAALWKKGIQVKGERSIARGTVIATFNSDNKYFGHAAIYESQTDAGINVVDQWITPPPRPIHRRMLRFGAQGLANNGDNFFVVD
jgi:hypothetical protein